MTTYTNVIFGPEAQGRSEESCKNAADELIHRVGLSQFRESYPHELSGGMQRRAELARALINNPAIMILDEPFRGLDAMTKGLMQEYYARLFESSRNTHLFVTTDIDEAIFLADRLLIMSNFPLRLREVIDVNLPRPRKLADVVESDMANDLKKQALTLLHEENLREDQRSELPISSRKRNIAPPSGLFSPVGTRNMHDPRLRAQVHGVEFVS
jgi:NitT/TauT family transport system ATP-binding protein